MSNFKFKGEKKTHPKGKDEPEKKVERQKLMNRLCTEHFEKKKKLLNTKTDLHLKFKQEYHNTVPKAPERKK